MTTPAAAALYEAQHVYAHQHAKVVVFNPHEKPVQELPVIFGFNNGGSSGWLNAVLIAEDGTELGGHICSSEAYMPADLGIIEGRDDRHEVFRAHYQDGYRMEFVSYVDLAGHTALNLALEKHDAVNTEPETP